MRRKKYNDVKIGNVIVIKSVSSREPELLAEKAVNTILLVSDKSIPEIREQAYAFRENIKSIIAEYIRIGMATERAKWQSPKQ